MMESKYWRMGRDREWAIWCGECVSEWSRLNPGEFSHYIVVKSGIYTGYLYNTTSFDYYRTYLPDLEVTTNHPTMVKI